MDTMRALFTKSGKFFWFSEKGWKGLRYFPCICAPVSMAEFASISLNISKYPWKCLNKLFWLCPKKLFLQGSEYDWPSCMFDRLLKMPCVLNVSGFWIWHGCICKGYAEFWILLNIAQYASIMPGYVAVCFNVPQCAWINSSKYVRVLNMRHHLHWLTSKGFERKPFRAFLIIKDQEFF